MITPLWCRTMARYNLWQNRAIIAAADPLGPVVRQDNKGAALGSVAEMLSHLLWTDRVWMARFDGGAVPDGTLANSGAQFRDWQMYRAERAQTDTRILDWASSLDDAALEGELFWMSKPAARHVSRPIAICVTHFFVQQVHHRGGLHTLLAAAGAEVEDSALFLMPDLLE
jgi:uncharacterized damage-inducible protein DinB